MYITSAFSTIFAIIWARDIIASFLDAKAEFACGDHRLRCGRLDAMKPWTVPDLLELGEAIAATGLHSFVVRRTLQRMERGEIMPLEAAEIVRQSSE